MQVYVVLSQITRIRRSGKNISTSYSHTLHHVCNTPEVAQEIIEYKKPSIASDNIDYIFVTNETTNGLTEYNEFLEEKHLNNPSKTFNAVTDHSRRRVTVPNSFITNDHGDFNFYAVMRQETRTIRKNKVATKKYIYTLDSLFESADEARAVSKQINKNNKEHNISYIVQGMSFDTLESIKDNIESEKMDKLQQAFDNLSKEDQQRIVDMYQDASK